MWAEPEYSDNEELIQVQKMYPKEVVCLTSALAYYGLTTFIPSAIQIAYPCAVNKLSNNVDLNTNTEFRQIKYLNNIIEQDHRFIKRLVRPGLGFKSFKTARRTLKGIEAFHMIKKGQIENLSRDALSEVAFINRLFDLVA